MIKMQGLVYARLQSCEGECFDVRQLPVVLGSRAFPRPALPKGLGFMAVTDCQDHALQMLLTYDSSDRGFVAVPGEGVFLNEGLVRGSLEEALKAVGEAGSQAYKGVSEYHPLQGMDSLYFEDSYPYPQLFKFILPLKELCRVDAGKASGGSAHKPLDKQAGQKWSNDDREQLKKFLLQYGYGRWRQIMRSSTTIGGKLELKSKPEIRAYGNSFIRTLEECLPEEETDLKLFLLNVIEERPEDPFIQSTLSPFFTRRLGPLQDPESPVCAVRQAAAAAAPGAHPDQALPGVGIQEPRQQGQGQGQLRKHPQLHPGGLVVRPAPFSLVVKEA